MASNFHNILGFLSVGLDFHLGLQVDTPPPIPDFPFWELTAVHPFVMGPNQQPTVLINGVPSVVDQHTPVLLWPHLPMDPLNALFPLDVVFGTQQCWLPRGTVLICDQVSTCCVAECISVNLDCWNSCSVPSDLVLQYATVQTSPSLSDFVFGALRAAINAAVSMALNHGFGALGKKFTKGKLGEIFNAGDKLADKLAKKGLGYQAAKRLGEVFTKDAEGKLRQDVQEKLEQKVLKSGLKKLSLERRVTQNADRFAQKIGAKIAASFLKRAGLDAGTFATGAGNSTGFDPARLLPASLGNTQGAKGGFGPFDGWKGPGATADSMLPLYGQVHGGVQGLLGVL